MNQVILMGRLTKDVELRKTQTNKLVANFTIAIQEQDKVDYVDCVVWESSAEFVTKWFGQGDGIFVTGKLKKDSYDDKYGNKQYKSYVLVNHIEFPTGKKQEAKQEAKPVVEVTDEDLPF